MAIYPKGTDIRDIKHFDRGEKVTFNCALHPEIAFRSKDPFVSQWFPANELTSECEFGIKDMNDYCPCTLRNGIWLTSLEYEDGR